MCNNKEPLSAKTLLMKIARGLGGAQGIFQVVKLFCMIL